ncbi:hypothetical protein FQN60_006449 [Etheostoma spectabile]|uniref:Uncharacterized protein n=1 Tax=Etheostoma spectabile TaxID=54343 RepID=A0A5J5CLF0_9PERO|nr:hypothetical protein FQN60_006449 [Etheostoma spectabile]
MLKSQSYCFGPRLRPPSCQLTCRWRPPCPHPQISSAPAAPRRPLKIHNRSVKITSSSTMRL